MLHLLSENLGDAVIIYIRGSLTSRDISSVISLWDTVTQGNPVKIAFHLKELESIDSTAIGTIVRFINETAGRGIRLVLLEPGKSIRQLFEAARLDQYVDLMKADEFRAAVTGKSINDKTL
ncbi:MAG TPA: STAS domain-containing protein [Spirochaetota bacterium]|nr:STAS domain-containing protein [Spirochaetota bacterium]HPQ53087.1 STAS domain-containing protein [Spirochaetota bacterium]